MDLLPRAARHLRGQLSATPRPDYRTETLLEKTIFAIHVMFVFSAIALAWTDKLLMAGVHDQAKADAAAD